MQPRPAGPQLPSIRTLHPYLPPPLDSAPSTSSVTYAPTSPPRPAVPQLPSIRMLHPYLPIEAMDSAPSTSSAIYPPASPPIQGTGRGGYHSSGSDGERDAVGDNERPKKKRRRQALSCAGCKRRKIRCDRKQPCAPCVRRGDQATCQEHFVEPVHLNCCTECNRRRIRCDRSQPCAPCVRRGDQAKCRWHVVEPVIRGGSRSGTTALEDSAWGHAFSMSQTSKPLQYGPTNIHRSASSSPRPPSLSGFSDVDSEESIGSPSSSQRQWNLGSNRHLSGLTTAQNAQPTGYTQYDAQQNGYRRPSVNTRPSSLSGFSDADSEGSIGSSFLSPPQREWNSPSYDLSVHQLILKELDLTGRVTKLDIYPFDSGSAADIYRGTLNERGLSVTVKIFRRMHSEPQNLEQTSRSLYEEARGWKRLDHPNILPFLGIALDLGLSPALISPLCVSGPVMKYLHNTKDSKHRLQMVIGVAAGLAYLHTQGLVHGNLCTKKVLIKGDGVPVICGYGISKALRQPANTTSLFSSPIRYAAPECFSVEAGTSSVRTPSGDVYAFAMVTLEILSGLEPYHYLPTEHAVFIHVLRGDRPLRTHLDQQAITNHTWRLLTSLWIRNPSSRPCMSNIISSLIRIHNGESTMEEDSDLIEPEAASPEFHQNENDDKSSSGEETSFEDSSLPDVRGRDLKGRVIQNDLYPFAGGGNSNIYRGKLTRSDGRKIRVAIKMIRISDDGSGQREDILRRLRREVEVWSRLKHKNILPLIGVCDDLAPSPVLISPFYKFGHVGTYLRKHPGIDRKELVSGVAAGLVFLHANNIIHGDLKVQNVLVDKRGAPCICDFGISKIINRKGFTTSSVGTAPYMAPELFFVIDGTTEEESPSTTKASDVYSFALLVLEILTSEPPKGRPTKPIVTTKILFELRPKRADYDVLNVPDAIWSSLDRCWTFEPQLRPSISEVFDDLNASFLARPRFPLLL